ncbi:hypothetical protein CC79DRAFT_1311159 [Sarocladium strictum]
MARLPGGWHLNINFIRLHYVWIIFCSLLAFPILQPYGNLAAIDTLFFGCSGSTESGLNTVDVKDLATYQQVYLYVIPSITNLMFINIIVVVVRLYWFRKQLRNTADVLGETNFGRDLEQSLARKVDEDNEESDLHAPVAHPMRQTLTAQPRSTTITFSDATDRNGSDRPAAESHSQQSPEGTGLPYSQHSTAPEDSAPQLPRHSTGEERIRNLNEDTILPLQKSFTDEPRSRSFQSRGTARHAARSLERAATSAFVLGKPASRHRSTSPSKQRGVKTSDLPQLSRQVTIGRNSNFYNLTEEDRERLGGLEYRALRLLLKLVAGYLTGLHVFGAICLLPWIHNAASKYTDWLSESGVGESWWAFYSAQTMVNNLGFTLTPDSMATFKDATWPVLVMTFLAFAGNTCYPVFLRLVIWIASLVVPRTSKTRESLQFLLDHPRRCYTLLFPSRPTWILFGIVFLLNFIDVILIITLDLDNPAVNDLSMGPRILSALFQAASARHTGTSTLNLAAVNPAVQFSLLTMMYIAIFPIAISIRASNTDEERTLGIWSKEGALNEQSSVSYVMAHVRNQLTFDLWYIFLGTFLIAVIESERIMDLDVPSFSLFPVLFEVTSAYGNVGLSLGGPSGSVSMSGHYKPLSKFVICAMMIRGRHRGLPYALDRAINLPVDTANVALRLSEPEEKGIKAA